MQCRARSRFEHCPVNSLTDCRNNALLNCG